MSPAGKPRLQAAALSRNDRPADAWETEHWLRHRPDLYERVGLAPE